MASSVVGTPVKDLAHGAVIVTVQDDNGTLSSHTLYVLGLGGKTIEQAIQDILTQTDAQTAALNAAFAQAGL